MNSHDSVTNRPRPALLAVAIAVAFAVGAAACGNASEDSGTPGPPPTPDAATAPAPDSGAPAPASDDEGDGGLISNTATWDKVRHGVRVILVFSADQDTFIGTVANATTLPLCGVRVSVELEDGTRFGPTAAVDLAVDATAKIEVPTEGAMVRTWGARPEIAPCGIGG